ncbi:MAG: transglutaminase domain-containing protein [Bacteroidia bacterium]
MVSETVKERFCFGLSNYSLSENWIAYISGKIFWSHLSAIVDPEDILKHRRGLCSQQTIVFLELLDRKKIKARSVGLGFKEGPGHFLSEVLYDGEWHLFDVTKEPQWSKLNGTHRSMDYYLLHKDSLFLAYDQRINKEVFDKITQKVEYGKADAFPAMKMLLFHKTCKILIYFFPIAFFLLFINSLPVYKRSRKEKAVAIEAREVMV